VTLRGWDNAAGSVYRARNRTRPYEGPNSPELDWALLAVWAGQKKECIWASRLPARRGPRLPIAVVDWWLDSLRLSPAASSNFRPLRASPGVPDRIDP
jgi:hypothetical protein